MRRVPRVKAAMTPFPYSVDQAAPLATARDLMRRHGIRHLPVVHGGRLVGVLSSRDLPAADADAAAGETRPVGAVAVMDAYVVDLETRLDEVARTMAARHSDCALVTRDGRLVGLFTTSDACRVLAEHLRALDPPPPDDEIA